MKAIALPAILSRPRARFVLKLVLGLFVAFVGLGFFAVPPAVRWLVESQATKLLGRTVQVERVRFNPLTLTARVESLRIAEADGKGEFFSLGSIETNLDVSSIWHRAPVLHAMKIERPTLRVVHLAGNRYNFSDILDRLNAGPKSPPSEPTRFSVNNIDLVDGHFEFDDKPVQRVHVVDKLQIGVPFVSSFPAGVASFVTPKLHAIVNGSSSSIEGKVKPFADRREASVDIALEPFDVVPYLAYVQGKLPVVVEKGRLGTRLRITWVEDPKKGQSFSVQGKVDFADVMIKDAIGPLLSFEALHVNITRLEPLANPLLARIASIQFDAPQLDVRRSAAGQINLAQLGEGKPVSTSMPVTTTASAPAAPIISVDQLAISRGTLRWQDEAVPGAYSMALSPVDLRLEKFDLAGEHPAKLELNAKAESGETLAHIGTIQPGKGMFSGHAAIAGLSLERLRPYFSQAVGPAKIAGMLGFEADYSVVPGTNGPAVKIEKVGAKLMDLVLSEPGAKQALLLLPETVLSDASADLEKRVLRIGAVSSNAARVRAARDKDGRFDVLEALLPPADDSIASAPAGPAEATQGQEPLAWTIELGSAELASWNVHFDDNTGVAPVALDVTELGVKLVEWSNQAGNLAEAAIQGRVNKKGRLAVNGRIGSEPLKGDLKLDLKSVDLLSVQPYIDKHYRVLVTQGAISAKGALLFDLAKPGHPQASYDGSLALEDFNSLDQLNDTDFLRWKRFALESVKFQFDPLAVVIGDVHVDDFYTRLILDSQGRFNLRELATAEDEILANAQSAPTAASSAAVASGAPMPEIRVGKVTLSEGHVNYSDRFIKPNYDANLRGVNGVLAGLSTDQASVAQLDLKARLDGAAPVEVSGQLNPFRRDRFLDIKAGVKDVDLTGVSTYAAKYVGYGIEKGKLSMDLQYKIRDRKLTAENQVFLDQLTFGKKVESPDATQLPVLFAVALMKNRKGEIDINLPISGTLDDPQFSVGGIVVRVVVNLITKAITAPFALIGSLFGGDGEELSFLDFPPGAATLPPAAEEKLRTLTKALTDRPALQLEIAGMADPTGDRNGIRRALLNNKLRALKAATMVKRGEAVGEVDSLEIAAEEYPGLLEAVYATEKIPDKPRNALGVLKSIPVEDMEKAVLGYLTASDEDLQSLAVSRARLVRDWLVDKGGIDPDRLFLVNAASLASQKDNKPPSARVNFSLK